MTEDDFAIPNSDDISAGDKVWEHEFDSPVGLPAVKGDTVFLLSVHDDNNYFCAIHALSGERKWKVTVEDELVSRPLVSGNIAYIGGSDYLHAIDINNKERKWKCGTVDGSRMLTLNNGMVIGVTGRNGRLYAIENGQKEWSFKTGKSASAPRTYNGNIYITAVSDPFFGSKQAKLYQIDSKSGEKKWEFEVDDSTYATAPIVQDNIVYFGGSSKFYAVSLETKEILWSCQIDPAKISAPAVEDGVVYTGSEDGRLYAIDTTTGEIKWYASTQLPPRTLEVSDHTVYVKNGNLNRGSFHIYEIATADGTNIWNCEIGQVSSIYTSGIAVDDNRVYVSNYNGSLFAINRTNKSQLFNQATATSGGEDDPSSPPEVANGSEPIKSYNVPDINSQAPNLSIDYGTLTDREPIGGGGNADVTKAIYPTPDGNVTLAIKEPRMAGTLHTEPVERMLEEAETWDKLDDHDHISGVVDYASTPIPWIAMEYMNAGHLGERSGGLGIPQTLWTVIAITKGVRHAHRRGVAHLDLKPANILFHSVDEKWDVPKVADWGLSKHLLDHSKSVEGLSPQYAAPEQFDEDFGSADDITDIYQLGAVFYELFTGEPPFDGKPAKAMHKVLYEQPIPPSEMADVPDELDRILLTALAKEKSDRYDNVAYLRDALQELYDEW